MNKITPTPDMYIPYNVFLRFQSQYADQSKRNSYSVLITTLTVETNVTKCKAGPECLTTDQENLSVQNSGIYRILLFMFGI